MRRNFNVILMEIAFLICGAVMEKKIVKMVVMKKVAMVPYVCVITKPSFLVGVQVSRTLVSFLFGLLGCRPFDSSSVCSYLVNVFS
jgi:hypothetical protein